MSEMTKTICKDKNCRLLLDQRFPSAAYLIKKNVNDAKAK